MPVNPGHRSAKAGKSGLTRDSPTRPFTPDQSDELLFQPEPRGSARTKVTADHTFSTVPGSHISESCLEPLNLLCNEPLSSHIIPDSTRFIIALGPVWRGPSSFSTQSGCEPWITVKQGEVLQTSTPGSSRSHTTQRNSSCRAPVFYMVMSGECQRKCKG